jgi:MFS family permease
MFLAITGFIFLGLMIAIGVIAGTFLTTFKADTGFSENYVLIIFIILILAGFFPLLYLFRFSKYTHRAVANTDKEELRKAIKTLKLFFFFFGLLIIIVLTVYFIALIVASSSMAFLKGMG